MNDKEIKRLQELQRKAEEFEEYALIKQKERELKERIATAKKEIRGTTWIDKLIGINNKSNKTDIRYYEIFDEPIRPINRNSKKEIVRAAPIKTKQTKAIKKVKKHQLKKVIKKSSRRKPLHEEVDDFIASGTDLSFDDDLGGLI